MRKILVTGSTGFIGRRLVERLIDEGSYVICLLRRNSTHNQTLAGKAHIEYVDFFDSVALKRIMSDAELVYHLAGCVYGVNKQELFKVNSEATLNLYSATKDSAVRRFVYLSSIAALGPSSAILSEDSTPQPISDYGKSKLKAEEVIKKSFGTIGTPIVVIRCPLIYGEGISRESRLVSLKNSILNGSFRFIGNGMNKISLCQIQSLIDFLAKIPLATLSDYEIFHIADENPIYLKELVKRMATFLNVSMPTKSISPALAFLVSYGCFCFSKIQILKDYLPPERLREIVGNWDMAIDKAKKYGYRPRADSIDVFKKTIISCS